MTLYLRGADRWTCVSSPIPPAPDAIWQRKNDHTLQDIHNCCEPDQQDLIAEYNHAKEAWDRLRHLYETNDQASIQRLYNEFNAIRKKSDESIAQYIARVKAASRNLTTSGETITTKGFINRVLEGLDQRYDAVKVYLSLDTTLDEERLTSALMGEESRQLLHPSNSRARSRSPRHADPRPDARRERSPSRATNDDPTRRDRRARFCSTCQIWGHDANNCFVLHPEMRRSPWPRPPPAPNSTYPQTYRPSYQPPPQQPPPRSAPQAYFVHAPFTGASPSGFGGPSPPQWSYYVPPPSYYVPPSSSTPVSAHPSTPAAAHVSSAPDPTPSPSASSVPDDYAMPLQLDNDSVWDFYDHAYVSMEADVFDHAYVVTGIDHLHTSALAIATSPALSAPLPDLSDTSPALSVSLPDLSSTSPALSAPAILPTSPTPPALAAGDYVQVPLAGQWLLDSGASNHFTSNCHILSDFRTVPDMKIMTGNGYITGKGIGNVVIHSSLGLRKIYDVMWVPSLQGRNNLLSIPQFILKGLKIVMFGNRASVFSGGDILLLQGTLLGKGFYVDMSVCRTTMQLARMEPTPSLPSLLLPVHCFNDGYFAMMAGCEDTQPLEVWHMRLGHLNQVSIQQLATTHATGLHIGPARPQTVSMRCESCLRGAQHKQISYQRRTFPFIKKLEHVWCDVKGPLLDRDVYGFHFFCVFVDEATRWIVAYPMLQKGHVFGAYKLFEARYERLSGERVLHIHFDGGGEYMSTEFQTHLRNRGVAVCVTQAYSPEMNAIAERTIRSIIEHASAMLWHACLPIGFWSQAVKCSVFLLNRSPHSALDGRTPFELFFGSKPNLGFLRIFGCRAIAHVPDELRTKTDWTSKATPNCIFLGYSETENLFELWDIEKRALIRKRDVVFWEHELGHPSLKPSALTHGISIYPHLAPSVSPPVAGRLVAAEESLTIPNAVPPQSDIPLPPPHARQTVTKLTPEPKERDRVRLPNEELQFIPWQPPHGLNWISEITSLDEHFMSSTAISGDLPTLDAPPDLNPDADIFHISMTVSPPPRSSAPLLDQSVPANYRQAIKHPRADRWRTAMELEIAKLRENHTWDLVDLPAGRKAFPNRWVYAYTSLQKAGDTFIEKARLVARGDLQKEGIDYHETFAPVVKFVSLRILLTRAASLRMRTRHFDIVSAFLHGDIDTDVYMQQPQGFGDGTNRVCHLRKALYGLCQAARQFYIKLDSAITTLGYRRLNADWAIWVRSDGAYIAAHVDDMAAAAHTEDDLDLLFHSITAFFQIKDLGSISRYLSIDCHYVSDESVFLISQSGYIAKLLSEYAMDNCFEVQTPVLDSERKRWDLDDTVLLNDSLIQKYQALIGSLLYLMHGTRPDLAFPVIKLSQYSSKPRDIHWHALKRILRYLKGTKDAVLRLGSPDAGSSSAADVIGYFDSAHADNVDRRSTCGYVFLLRGSPISWCTKIQRTIALSTTEAELMAGTEATRELLWIKSLIDEVYGPLSYELRGDNQGSLALATNPVYHQRSKHIHIRHRFICEVVNSGLLTVQYVPSTLQLADGFTKPLPRDLHHSHCLRYGLDLRYLHPNPAIPSKRRKLQCDECGNLFADEAALRKHRLKKES